jgi:hypothetical protein
MLDISHLVIIGCSFSYGDGLLNPKEDSWPGLLAKRLNVPIVNLSSRGGGNDRIMRRLYEYHYLNSTNNNNPFYIIAYSHSSRREEYFKSVENYMVVDMKPDSLSSENPFSVDFIYNYNTDVSTRKKLMIESYILDFLNVNNLNYLTTDFMPDNEEELYNLRDLYPDVYNRVYFDQYRMQDLGEISFKYPKLPCGHDDIEAQLEIENYVYNELLSRYEQPKTLQQDYTTLRQYNDHYRIVGSNGDIAWL